MTPDPKILYKFPPKPLAKPHRPDYPLLWLAAWALILAGALVLLAGCGHPSLVAPPIQPPASKIATPERARDVSQTLTAVAPKLATIKTSIDSLTPENVATVKPVLLEQFAGVMQDFSNLTVKGGKVDLLTASVANDVTERNKLAMQISTLEKRITVLEAADPVKGWFEIIGGALTALGMAVVVMSFLPWTLWAAPFRGIAISACIVGFTLLTLATFLRLTEIVIGITLGVGFIVGIGWLAFYVWQNRKSLGIATGIVKSIEAAKTYDKTAAGNVVDISKVVQPLDVKAFVRATIAATAGGK